MISFNLGEPADFPFIDRPHSSAISEGYRTLKELGALTPKHKLTAMGKIMAAMPIDPCIARIIIEANKKGCLKEIIIIATVLAIQDPRVRPLGFEQQADESHRKFAHPQSDFLSYLNIWNLCHKGKKRTSWTQLKKFCKANYLSFQRMREWMDLHEQMKKIVLGYNGFQISDSEGSYEDIHKSLATGFIRNIAQKMEGHLYQGTSNKELLIFPGSQQFKKKFSWIVAASFLETNRLYALTVAAIEPEWLEETAGKLLNFSWSDPRYLKKTGQVVASEQVTLFGLIIVPSRQVNFGKTSDKNRQEARSIFLQKALVECNLTGNFPFLSKNRNLVHKWQDMESRLRKRNLLSPDIAIYDFYDARLPKWVYDKSSLIKYLRKNNPGHLILSEDDILLRRPELQELADYPPAIKIGTHTFSLSYVFDPASDKDGVTVTIPAAVFPTLPETLFEWLVPGLIAEKVTFLLKSLPKRLRKKLVPLSNTVDLILDNSDQYKGSLFKAIENGLLKMHKLSIHRSEFQTKLPSHLQMRFSLIDTTGKEIASGRNFQDLIHHQQTDNTVVKLAAGEHDRKYIINIENQSFFHWEFPELPHSIPLFSANNEICGYLYPAIIQSQKESQECLKIRFTANQDESLLNTRDSLRFYLKKQHQQHIKPLKKYCSTTLSGPSSLWILKFFASKADAVEMVFQYVIDAIFQIKQLTSIPVKPHIEILPTEIYAEGKKIIDSILALLRLRQEIIFNLRKFRELSIKTKANTAPLFDEIEMLLNEILPADFLSSPRLTLEDSGRYLRGLSLRMERAHSDYSKDNRKNQSILQFQNFLDYMREKKDIHPEYKIKLEQFQHMLQEYRLSQFSPEIKTRYPVSAKKLLNLEKEIRKGV